MSRKKEDLLTTAERLFYQHGFHAIGLKAIVQEAGIALMTLYNHFDSKEALILEILKRREEAYFSLLEETVEQETGPIEERLALGHLRWLQNSTSNGCMFLRAKEEFGSEPEQLIVQKVLAHKENLQRFFAAYNIAPADAIRLALLFEGATALAEISQMEQVEEAMLSMVHQ
ncbi:TetR/AcrR family transcriptional regulator [Alkalicoccus daliensis]|uniref:Transcriptional regulator, TetR family n=1 Tax=Alkalicoccus daliensis TaxID=745820 RepID=A0A1H0D7U5_9BACI|nr:TetR/AcrR family transcriptional regulator [Alkalicoccus daliensis]SDN66274.1 transcriptional regulator, TetR family [Alkalicoccus daliensis]